MKDAQKIGISTGEEMRPILIPLGEAVINGKRIERHENDRVTGGPAFDRVVHFHRRVSPDRQLGRLR